MAQPSCETLYRTVVLTQLAYSVTTSAIVTTLPPRVGVSTSTSFSTACSPCSPATTGAPDPAGPQCVPVCATATALIPVTVTSPAITSTETLTATATLTNVVTGSTPTATSCLAASTRATANVPVVTPVPTPTPKAQPLTTLSVLTGPRIVTSLSTQLIVSTKYDGEVVSSSAAVPVLVQADDLSASSGQVAPGAIAGAVVGGCAFAVVVVLILLGCLARRGPLRSLGVAFAGDEGLGDEDWQPQHHAEPDADHLDVLPSEKDIHDGGASGGASEDGIETLAASRLSYVPHRSVSSETSSLPRPLSLQSSLSGFHSAHSLEESSFDYRQSLPSQFDMSADPYRTFGPGMPPPPLSRRGSAPRLSQYGSGSAGIGTLRPVEPHQPRLYRAASSPAGFIGAIAEADEDGGSSVGHSSGDGRPPRESRPPSLRSASAASSPISLNAPLTPLDASPPTGHSRPKRASTMPTLADPARRLSKIDADGRSDGGRWLAPMIVVHSDES